MGCARHEGSLSRDRIADAQRGALAAPAVHREERSDEAISISRASRNGK